MPSAPTPIASSDGPRIEVFEPLCAVFRRRLKGEGLKYTPERAQVLDAVVRAEGLFEAEGILQGLRRAGHRVSKATVYRTIRLLVDAGIIQRVFSGADADQASYQLVYGRGPSDLLIRVDTGGVELIEVPGLTELCARLCRERGLEAEGHRLQVFAKAASAPDRSGAGPVESGKGAAGASRRR